MTEEILRVSLENAHYSQANRIIKIHIKIGEITGFNAESIKFYFSILSKGTIAENAVLEMEIVPSSARCLNCRKVYNIQEMVLICPYCGNLNSEIIAGKDVIIESLEVE
ncbi:MAG: hydrogenase maturation nickel metallochaperone HypA [Candidatus Aminicenantia bacterium]